MKIKIKIKIKILFIYLSLLSMISHFPIFSLLLILARYENFFACLLPAGRVGFTVRFCSVWADLCRPAVLPCHPGGCCLALALARCLDALHASRSSHATPALSRTRARHMTHGLGHHQATSRPARTRICSAALTDQDLI